MICTRNFFFLLEMTFYLRRMSDLFLLNFDLLLPYYCFLSLLFVDYLAAVFDLLLEIVLLSQINREILHFLNDINFIFV